MARTILDTAAARTVEHLVALDLPAALAASQRARAEAEAVLAFLRRAARTGADPDTIRAGAVCLIARIETSPRSA